ncbi:MAG: response regulator transcription factor [Actinomycetota bacterium]|nr:response regulator transcription factor [Actinomycetota bacterium]
MSDSPSTVERRRSTPRYRRASIEAFHLVLLTDRPPVHAFFAGVGRRAGAAYVLTQLPVDAEAVTEAVDELEGATAAVIDAGLDPAAAILVCEELHRVRPTLPMAALVCCSHSITPWSLRTLIAAGVSSVLDLEATADEVAHVLRSVAHGGSILRLQRRHGHKALLKDILASSGPRTETQLELLELVARGLPDHEIGRRLHVSPHTVKHHIEQLRDEVGARNRIELAAWAGRHGFYRPDA